MAAIEPEPVPPDTTAPTRPAARAAALAGIRDVAPLVAGHLPFAVVIGVTVAAAPPVLARWLSTILIFGGSAQLITLELLDAGSPLVLVIGAGLVTNARILAYSGSLARHWRAQPLWFRCLGAALIIDPTWAMAQRDLADGIDRPARHRAYFLAEAGTLAIGWWGAVTLGVVAGARLTEVIGAGGALALAAPLSLAALVAPQLVSRPVIVAATTAAVIGWLSADLPAGTGLLLAIAAATTVGAVLDRDPDLTGESP